MVPDIKIIQAKTRSVVLVRKNGGKQIWNVWFLDITKVAIWFIYISIGSANTVYVVPAYEKLTNTRFAVPVHEKGDKQMLDVWVHL